MRIVIILLMIFASSLFSQISVWGGNPDWNRNTGLHWAPTSADEITSKTISFDTKQYHGKALLAVKVDILSGSGNISFEIEYFDGIDWIGLGDNEFKRADDYSVTTSTFQTGQEGYSWHYTTDPKSTSNIEGVPIYVFRLVLKSDGAVDANIISKFVPY